MAKNDTKPAFVKRESFINGKEYAQLLGKLKERFRRSQIKAAVKVNTQMLEFYWEMGRDISRLYANAKYDSEMPLDFGLVPRGHHIDIFTRSKFDNND
ncbi:MAG: hypothetical protein K2G78_05170 [Muribaculaceae bacterium]|nr:hypothetical protein [Muribaculaceae bacterium]